MSTNLVLNQNDTLQPTVVQKDLFKLAKYFTELNHRLLIKLISVIENQVSLFSTVSKILQYFYWLIVHVKGLKQIFLTFQQNRYAKWWQVSFWVNHSLKQFIQNTYLF